MDWPSLITAAGGILVTAGGGIKYLISRSDGKTQALQNLLQSQITELRGEVQRTSSELERYRVENLALTRHVGILEGILRAKEIPVPPMAEAPVPVAPAAPDMENFNGPVQS